MSQLPLTPEQIDIVKAPIAHHVITAVAGSGKTTTLAHRIAYLLQQGMEPKRLLVLMFNRAARDDFRVKLQAILPPGQLAPEVRTFHAMGYRLYQRFIRDGYLKPFNPTILSEKEVLFQLWRLTTRHLPADKLKTIKRFKQDHMEMCARFVETVKSRLDSPEQVFRDLELDKKYAYFVPLFEQFEHWRAQNQRIGYADMLYDPVRAVSSSKALQALVKDKMDMILVDEYQDTNAIQHELLTQIAGERARITVVGDPDQTIYEFRGARPEYMLKDFSLQFPEAEQLTLSTSFRYGHRVSLLANHLIRHNSRRHDVLCKSAPSNPQTQVHVHACHHEPARLIKRLRSIPVTHYRDTVILLRIWSQSVSIELALLDNNIPYRLEGHAGVFSATETLCLRALLELACGQFFTLNQDARRNRLQHLLRFPHVGLGDHDIQTIASGLSGITQNIGATLQANIPDDLKQIQRLKLGRLARALSAIEHQTLPVSDTLYGYAKTTELFEGIRSLSLSAEHAEEKVLAVEATLRFLCSLPGDAADVLLRMDALQQQSRQEHREGVLITTLHRSKGREWQTVIIPGLNDIYYPYLARQTKEGNQYSVIESERRLLYVGITRARQTLDLLVPAANGAAEAAESRFQHELNIGTSMYAGEHIDAGMVPENAEANTMLKRYISEAGLELSAPPPSATPAEHTHCHHIEARRSHSPIWSRKQVHHALFGAGTVVEENQDTFAVKFDGEDLRVFSKRASTKDFSDNLEQSA